MQDNNFSRLKSSKSGLVWPAAPDEQAARRLTLLLQLQESEWWTPDKLETFQFLQLTELVRHAIRTVPYYRRLLKNTGWNPRETLVPDLYRNFPVLTRENVNRAGNNLNSVAVPKEHGRIHKSTTSGSTGNPVTIYKTGWSAVIWDAITLRDHLWQGREFSGSLGIIRHLPVEKARPPHGTSQANWGPPVSPIFDTGKSHALNIRSTTTEQLDWLLMTEPDYLLTFPSAAEAMARLSLKRGVFPSRLKELRTIGETLSPEARDVIEQSWKVRVTDCYSAQETGYLALPSPGATHYLVQAEAVYLEILDEHNNPCKAGETGRVVVTPLHNFATPLIRYALDDYAVAGNSSPCGRGLPVLQRVMGRTRNMLVLPDGERRFASMGVKSFNVAHGERIKRYQVIQKSREELLVKLVIDVPYSPGSEDALKKHIQTWVNYPFRITIEYVADIPRSNSGKYEDFRCEVSYET